MDTLEESYSHEEVAPRYNPEDRVLAKDANNTKHFYEAIVRKVKCISTITNEWSFLVHYQGWNSRWDRWVTNDDVVLDSPENRKTYLLPTQQAIERHEASAPPAKRRRTNDPKKKKLGREKLAYQEYCELPFTLRTVLVDEFHFIKRRGFDSPVYVDREPTAKVARSVHDLPGSVTVKQAIQQYQKKRGGAQEDEEKQQQVSEFCSGLCLLFDKVLPLCLLYPEELPQYEALDFQGKTPADLYGCEFLLRLYVRLPYLIQAEPKNQMEINGPMLQDLIVLLQKNRQACFKPKFREPKYSELLSWERQMVDQVRLQKKMDAGKKKITSNTVDDNGIDDSNGCVGSPMKQN